MTVGVLVVVAGQAAWLSHVLDCARPEKPVDLLVVDNGSPDGCAEVARRAGARVVELERTSFCAATNTGLREVRGDAVALLQGDTFVEPGYLRAALAVLEREPGVAVVAPKLLRVCGPAPGEELGEIDTAGMVIDRRRKNGLVGHGAPARAYARGGDVFGADGAGAVWRRSALDDCAVGGEIFDEDLELWASDADLAWRARSLGWRAVYEPRAVVRHVRRYSPSTRSAMSEASRRLQFRNRLLMMLKNDSAAELARDLPYVLLYELLAAGHVVLRERHLARSYRDAARLVPGALRRRRALAPRRRGRVPFGLVLDV